MIYVNYSKDGKIESFSEGPDDSQNDPAGCETLEIDPAVTKFDPDRMKILGGQLVMKG